MSPRLVDILANNKHFTVADYAKLIREKMNEDPKTHMTRDESLVLAHKIIRAFAKILEEKRELPFRSFCTLKIKKRNVEPMVKVPFLKDTWVPSKPYRISCKFARNFRFEISMS